MRVLVIDDMSFARDFIRQSLSQLGFKGELDEARNLKSAMNIIQDSLTQKNFFDLILTDLHLPDGYSTEMIKKIRATKTYKETPIILMTTEDNRDKIVDAIGAGVNDYCFKPVDRLELFDKIKGYF